MREVIVSAETVEEAQPAGLDPAVPDGVEVGVSGRPP